MFICCDVDSESGKRIETEIFEGVIQANYIEIVKLKLREILFKWLFY